jgi:hypothetical protein
MSRTIQEMRPGDYVKVNGEFERIASIYGVDPETGRLAKPSEGGFGVITESGRNVSMWEAESYHKKLDQKKWIRVSCAARILLF